MHENEDDNQCATAPTRRIQRLDASSSSSITRGQVIQDLAGAVKELIENALDAHSTNIGSFCCVFLLILFCFTVFNSFLTSNFIHIIFIHFSDIRLINYGIDTIEVCDNGTGVRADDICSLCKSLCLFNLIHCPFSGQQHYTSKINCIDDLQSIASFGFRGEALNALCSIGFVFSFRFR
jgi:DNA mismatch repair protein PMS2